VTMPWGSERAAAPSAALMLTSSRWRGPESRSYTWLPDVAVVTRVNRAARTALLLYSSPSAWSPVTRVVQPFLSSIVAEEYPTRVTSSSHVLLPVAPSLKK